MRVTLLLAARRLASAITSQSFTVRRMLLLAAGIIAVLVVAPRLAGASSGWLLIAVGVIGFVYCVWKRPALAAFLVLYLAARTGGAPLLIAAPLTVMLARRDIRRRLEIPQSVSRTVFTLASALVAFLVTLMYADLSFGSSPGGTGSSGATSAQPAFGQEGGSGENIVHRIMRALGFGTGSGSGRPGEFVLGASPPPDDPDGWPWLLLLVIAVALAILGVLAYWLWRRRRGTAGEPVAARARPLARLEAVGHMVGRERSPSEGALTYASALAAFTGDRRLDQAGNLVSSEIYESSSADPRVVDDNLSGLEAEPPEKPPRPPLRSRLRARFADSAITPKGAALGLVGVVLVVVAGWKVAPRLGQLSSEPDAFAFGPSTEPPEEWDWLQGVAAEQLDAWQVCGASQGAYVVQEAIAGVVHLDEPVAASARAEVYSYADEPISELTVRRDDTEFRRYGDALGQPWLQTSAWQLALRSFESIEGVAADLSVRDAVRSTGIDRFGDKYVRFESLPVSYEDSLYSGTTAPRLGLPVTDLVWVLDVWADADGRPSRARVMTQEPTWRWAEWRRVPAGSDRLVPPSCPNTAPYTDRAGWVGSEPWTRTLVAPPLIGYDANGNPFDTEPWETGQPFELRQTTVGGIVAPAPTLTFADAYAMPERGFGGSHAPTVTTDWVDDATVAVLDLDQWPTAALIEQDAVVAEWRVIGELNVFDSALAIALTPDLSVDPDIWWEQVDRLWDSNRMIEIELDRRPGVEAYVIDLPDASQIVGGYDRAGELVSILVRDGSVQWRRLDLPGRAPRSVLEREAELAECIAGTRPFGPDGRCE